MGATKSTIGILGDGQLAMMLGEAAQRQRIPVVALGQDPNSSFARRFPTQWYNESSFDFSSHSSLQCLTLENEFHTVESLQKIEQQSQVEMIPGSKDFLFFQNKIEQRKFFHQLKLASPEHGIWDSTQSLPSLNFPLVLKKPVGGYDGYGVRFVQDAHQFEGAARELSTPAGGPLLWEAQVSIEREFAQGVLLDGRGGWIALPLFETIQKNGICVAVLSHSTLEAPRLASVQNQCLDAIKRIAQAGLCGLYHFEFFYTKDGRVLMNEGAPRPHNSAHLTQDGCELSQFDLLTLFLRDRKLPLDSGTVLTCRPGIMLNLLGTGSPGIYTWSEPQDSPRRLGFAPRVHLYDKLENRKGRKMGHINWMLEHTSNNPAPLLLQAVEAGLK